MNKNWIEYPKPKQYLTRETAIDLLFAQEKRIHELEDELRAFRYAAYGNAALR